MCLEESLKNQLLFFLKSELERALILIKIMKQIERSFNYLEI